MVGMSDGPPPKFPPSAPAALVRFLHLAGRLKTTKRTGWLDRGVPPAQTESVADHSYRTALLAWIAAAGDPTLDRDRVLRLALVHDLAEASAGDITPYDRDAIAREPDASARRASLERRHVRSDDDRAAKRAAERAALARMLAGVSDAVADEVRALWEEYEAAESPEARWVKQADKLESYLQSREYAAADPKLPVASFAAEVADVVTHPTLAALRDEIAVRRDLGAEFDD